MMRIRALPRRPDTCLVRRTHDVLTKCPPLRRAAVSSLLRWMLGSHIEKQLRTGLSLDTGIWTSMVGMFGLFP